MATVLNPNAPLFFPTAAVAPTVSATPYGDELSLIYSPCRPTPPQPYSVFIPQRYDHGCISKGAIYMHPPLIYYQPTSQLSLIPNFSYYIPPLKYPFPIIFESEAAEVSVALPRLGDDVGGVEEQRFPMEVRTAEEQCLRTVSSSRLATRGLRARFGNRQVIKRSSKLWVRKSSSAQYMSPQEATFPIPGDLQFCDGEKSTVMIKNIPNKLSRNQMLDLLDQHCRSENQKIKEEGTDVALSEFDFLYLPMDFISGNNLGYAFVNFTSPAAARRLYQHMHMMSWTSLGSRKTCEISHAKIQGLEELVKHFRRSIFTCESAEYLPVYFHPSRDGSRDSAEQLVGKLVHRALS